MTLLDILNCTYVYQFVAKSFKVVVLPLGMWP